MAAPDTIILMGVSGCGKTTVGRLLAKRLGGRFLDADRFHPPENIARMSRGEPLDDAQRAPWLQRMRDEVIRRHGAETDVAAMWGSQGGNEEGESGRGPVVLACSALKDAYRRVLDEDGRAVNVVWVYLRGDAATIRGRIDARTGHYMKSGLLESQFAALEEPRPGEALVVDIDAAPETVVERIVGGLGLPNIPASADGHASADPPP